MKQDFNQTYLNKLSLRLAQKHDHRLFQKMKILKTSY